MNLSRLTPEEPAPAATDGATAAKPPQGSPTADPAAGSASGGATVASVRLLAEHVDATSGASVHQRGDVGDRPCGAARLVAERADAPCAMAAAVSNESSPAAVKRVDNAMTLTDWANRNVVGSHIRILGAGIWAGFITFALAFPTLMILSELLPSQLALRFALFALMLVGGFCTGVGCLVGLVWKTVNASNKMPMPPFAGVDAIGPLLERSLTDYRHHAEIYDRLSDLLPRLIEDDASVLGRRHYEILNQYLDQVAFASPATARRAYTGNKAYLVAVLTAYAQVGDGRALPSVQRLATGRCAAAVRDLDIQRAAERCLPRLERAAAAAEQQETLLRSANPAPDADALLRAAQPAPSNASEDLLRPDANTPQQPGANDDRGAR